MKTSDDCYIFQNRMANSKKVIDRDEEVPIRLFVETQSRYRETTNNSEKLAAKLGTNERKSKAGGTHSGS